MHFPLPKFVWLTAVRLAVLSFSLPAWGHLDTRERIKCSFFDKLRSAAICHRHIGFSLLYCQRGM